MVLAPNVFRFSTKVWSGGYRWATAKELRVNESSQKRFLAKGEKVLVAVPGPAARLVSREVNAPALFRDVAAIDRKDLQALVRLANEYGTLGCIVPMWHDEGEVFENAISLPMVEADQGFAEVHQGKSDKTLCVSPWTSWNAEISQLCWAVRVVDALREKDAQKSESEFQDLLMWHAPKDDSPPCWFPSKTHYQSHWSGTVLWRAWPALLDEHAPRQVVASLALANVVNARLADGVRPVLALDAKNELVESLATDSLSAFIWSQVFTTISTGSEHRKCPGCKEWFEVGTKNGGTQRQQYCSGTCRVRALRKRKAAESQEEGAENE